MSRWNNSGRTKRDGKGFNRLVAVMARLRGPRGCPWDRAQDIDSLRPYLIEEAYEVLSALEDGNTNHVREELGDLLLQVVFLSRLFEEKKEFSIDDVIEGIVSKLIVRHPHVFGSGHPPMAGRARTPQEVLKVWEGIKNKTKRSGSVLDGIPKMLPALLRAQRTTDKAARVGFDWPTLNSLDKKLEEELREFSEASSRRRKEEELGDVLFTLVNIARRLGINAETSLRKATRRFTHRFQYIEKALGEKIRRASLKEMDRLWIKAKRNHPRGTTP